jgi:hypothetical protein
VEPQVKVQVWIWSPCHGKSTNFPAARFLLIHTSVGGGLSDGFMDGEG